MSEETNPVTIVVQGTLEFVKEINIDEKIVRVSLIPGFIDGAVEA